MSPSRLQRISLLALLQTSFGQAENLLTSSLVRYCLLFFTTRLADLSNLLTVDSQHPYIHRQTLVLTNSTIYTWRINFPHDSLLRLSVSDRRGYFAGARTSLVRRISASTSSSNERCVPRAHQFHPRWWTSTVAIMLFSATALVLVFGVIMVAGTVWLNKRRQRNEERQQLLEDSD